MSYKQKYNPVQTTMPPPYQMPPNQPGYAPPLMNQPGYTQAPLTQLQFNQSTIMQTVNTVTQQLEKDDRMIIGPVEGHRDWSASLCGCFSDIKTFVFVWFCPMCALSDVSSKLGESCCLTYCLPGIVALPLRTRLRTLGGIKGSICNDAMAVSCCFWCSIIQMSREVDTMGLK